MVAVIVTESSTVGFRGLNVTSLTVRSGGRVAGGGVFASITETTILGVFAVTNDTGRTAKVIVSIAIKEKIFRFIKMPNCYSSEISLINYIAQT
jgi:hypothetical protein